MLFKIDIAQVLERRSSMFDESGKGAVHPESLTHYYKVHNYLGG
jgi:hypothetical protein